MANVWANLVACHPKATYHIAWRKNCIRHIENRFSPYLIFFLTAVWALVSGVFRIVFGTLVCNAGWTGVEMFPLLFL